MSCGCGGISGPLCRVDGRIRSRPEVEREVTRLALMRCGRGTLLDGIRVRWLGLVWIGVPEPLRWVIGERDLPMDLPGCGCIARLREWVDRLIASDPPAPS